MDSALVLGPLVVPVMPLVVLASAVAGRWVAARVARRAGVDPASLPVGTLWWGLLAARLAFVAQYLGVYAEAPWRVLDVRDGGWHPALGLVAVWLHALVVQRRQPALRRPMAWGTATGTGLFLAGAAAVWLGAGRGQPLPELALSSLEGPAVSLRQFTGKPTVVNLWATWCPPCTREMPALVAAQQRHPEANIVLVDQGEDAATVARWLQQRQLAPRFLLLDPARRTSAAFQAQGYPTTLFFDAEGRLVSRRLGEVSEATLREQLERLRDTP